MNSVLELVAANNNQKQELLFGSASGYNEDEIKLYGVPENYLRIVNTDYYMPKEL